MRQLRAISLAHYGFLKVDNALNYFLCYSEANIDFLDSHKARLLSKAKKNREIKEIWHILVTQNEKFPNLLFFGTGTSQIQK